MIYIPYTLLLQFTRAECPNSSEDTQSTQLFFPGDPEEILLTYDPSQFDDIVNSCLEQYHLRDISSVNLDTISDR